MLSYSRPIHLCPVCLRKLQHAVGFDYAARYRALEAFYQRAGLRPEAAWVRRRLAFIQGDSGAPGAAGGDEQAAPGSEN